MTTNRKISTVAVALALGVLLGFASPARAATLDFDTLVNPNCQGGITAGYGGLSWSPDIGVECDADYYGTYANPVGSGSPSGEYAAYSAAGESHIASLAGTFTFGGAAFSTFAFAGQYDPLYSAISLAILGYRPGDAIDAPTYSTAFDLDLQYATQTLSWTGLTELVLFGGNGPAGDLATVYGMLGYSWLMDDMDVTLETQVVPAIPEPASLLLLMTGLPAVMRRVRARRR